MSLGKQKILSQGATATPALTNTDNFDIITYIGNGGVQKITGYIRKGAGFDGNSSFIDTGIINHTLAWGYAVWFNTSHTSSSGCILATLAGSNSQSGVDMVVQSNGKLRAFFHNSSSNMGGTTFGSSLNDGNWHFVAFTWDGINGNDATVRVDGTKHTVSTSIAGTTSADASLKIGRFGVSAGGSFFNGVIDQVRIFNKKLSDSELDTLYAETASSATKSTTDIFSDGSGVALYELNENSYSSNFLQGAVFDGTNSRITLPKMSNMTDDVTVSGWVKLGNTTTSTRLRFVEINLNSNGYAGTFMSHYKPSTGEWQVRVGNGTSSDTTVLSHTYTLTQDVWYHICFTRDDSTNVTKLYVNGTEEDSETVTASVSFPSDATGIIGDINYSHAIEYNWLGSFDQIRIFSSPLSASDVTKLYNESSQIPTATLVSHYKLDGNATDSAGSNNGTETTITYAGGVYSGTDTDVSFLGLDFSPSFVWVKQRNDSEAHFLMDSIRGSTETLYSSGAFQEVTESQGVTSFDSNGFTLGTYAGMNGSNDTYVAWCWKAAASNATNNDGTTQSTVRANTAAGFSIVKFAATNTSIQVGHGLTSAPNMIIWKNLDTDDNWYVYFSGLSSPNTQWLNLNLTSAFTTNATNNFSSVTSSTFTSHLWGGAGSNNIIAYCFADVAGYQKIGVYDGDGGTNNQISLGFQPRFLIIKLLSSAGQNWNIMDDKRLDTSVEKVLYANTSDAEDSLSNHLDFTATGFTLTKNSTAFNSSGENYFYWAIA